MRKIPTLFERDPEDRKHVLNSVAPGCEWVLAGEGRATRKYDGTCVMVRDGKLFGRREVKPGKTPPADFEAVEHDATTHKTVGWVPVTDGPEWATHREAMRLWMNVEFVVPPDGTYELCGPKVNGNPEGLATNVLIAHGDADGVDAPRDYNGLAKWLTARDYEGIVWHHPDGRMAKLKKRDFR